MKAFNKSGLFLSEDNFSLKNVITLKTVALLIGKYLTVTHNLKTSELRNHEKYDCSTFEVTKVYSWKNISEAVYSGINIFPRI